MTHLMLVPSTACPASCTYCFGPHHASPPMSPAVLALAVEWIQNVPDDERVDITFHGGEPLTAGIGFYRQALPLLSRARSSGRLHFSIQSNLWQLSEEFLDLLIAYDVNIGTSLDGPEWINDRQRGNGCFRRTMDKINLIRQYGRLAGCIATLTSDSVFEWKEIINFFIAEQLDVSLHAALPTMHFPDSQWVLGAEAYEAVMLEIFNDVFNRKRLGIHVDPFETMARGFVSSRGSCVFGDCLGKFLAIGPDGGIYPCQRFVGITEFQLGSLLEHEPGNIKGSPIWNALANREQNVAHECAGCPFWDICHGGCPYNALACGGGSFRNGLRDPYCPVYQKLFSILLDRAAQEFFSVENMLAIIDEPISPDGLFRVGNIIERMRR